MRVLEPAPLETALATVLARRLAPDAARPLAVGLSGGGDSLALLLLVHGWARDAGRQLVVLTVDHGLRAESAIWTEQCRATAERLGHRFRVLPWEGEKPVTGLPAAARRARHRLLAQATREVGASVLLLGHTADDILEAHAMRQVGSTTPDPREWAPSPAWPDGRGVFLLRPLLGVRRAALREWLAARGQRWIEDPANDDLRYARSRARRLGVKGDAAVERDEVLALAGQATEAFGVITLPRNTLRRAQPHQAARFVRLAAVCAGGGDRLPAANSAERLATRLRGPGDVVASLAGSRVTGCDATAEILREGGEAGRGGLLPIVSCGGEVVWDGRFLIADAEAVVQRLFGLVRRLPSDQRRAVSALPAAARGGLPAIIGLSGEVSCPLFDGRAKSLVGQRFAAAAGRIDREPD